MSKALPGLNDTKKLIQSILELPLVRSYFQRSSTLQRQSCVLVHSYEAEKVTNNHNNIFFRKPGQSETTLRGPASPTMCSVMADMKEDLQTVSDNYKQPWIRDGWNAGASRELRLIMTRQCPRFVTSDGHAMWHQGRTWWAPYCRHEIGNNDADRTCSLLIQSMYPCLQHLIMYIMFL